MHNAAARQDAGCVLQVAVYLRMYEREKTVLPRHSSFYTLLLDHLLPQAGILAARNVGGFLAVEFEVLRYDIHHSCSAAAALA